MNNIGADRKNLDQVVYEQIKALIIERTLKPGDKIYQEKLAKDLGISRTPLVNALKKLEHEKLITAIPRRGFFVRFFSKPEMIQIFELRELLEGLATRRAAQHITDGQIKKLKDFFKDFDNDLSINDVTAYAKEDRRFHDYLFDIGGREFLKSVLSTYNFLTMSHQVDRDTTLVRPPGETLPEHMAIIDAICNRNPVKAEELTRLHLKRSRERLIQEAKADQTSPFFYDND